jgi:hypothetical protein
MALGSSIGCHILGLVPIPCTKSSECPEAQRCINEVCAVPDPNKPTPLPPPDEGVEVEVDDGCVNPAIPVAAKSVVLSGRPTRGIAALLEDDETEFGPIDATRRLSFPLGDCPSADACDLAAGNLLPPVPQPVARRSIDPVGLHLANRFTGAVASASPTSAELRGLFMIELLFRAPPTPDDDGTYAPVFGQYNPANVLDDSWLVLSNSDAIYVVAGGLSTPIADPTGGVWHHLMCLIDGGELTAPAAPFAIACVADGVLVGAPSLFASNFTWDLNGDDLDLRFGDESPIAIANIWLDPDLPRDLFSRTDALATLARKRLLAYLGFDVAGPGISATAPRAPRIMQLTSPFGSFPFARLFPLSNAGQPQGDAFVRVGPRWPVVTVDAQDELALLLEDQRDNLIETQQLNAWGTTGCPLQANEPVSVPLGQACALQNNGVHFAALPDVTTDDASVFSLWVTNPDNVTVALTTTTGSVIGCNLGGGCGDDVVSEAATTIDGVEWQRRYFTHVASAEAQGFTDVDISVVGSASVWAPQLEHGRQPSTPTQEEYFEGNDVFTNHADHIQIELPDFGATDGVTVAAEVTVPAVGAGLFVAVQDGGQQQSNGVALLRTTSTATGIVSSAQSFTGGSDETTSPVAQPTLRVGAAFGAAECTDCTVALLVPEHRAFDAQVLVAASGGESTALSALEVASVGEGIELDRRLRLAVEPRVPGCGAIGEAVAFDASDGGCDGGYCARDERDWGVSGTRRYGPGVGEFVLPSAASTSIDPLPADQAWLIEARFQAERDGSALELRDGDGSLLLAFGVEGDDVVVRVAGDDDRLSTGAGNWVHVTCWQSPTDTICARNLSTLGIDGELDRNASVVLGVGHADAAAESVSLPGETGPLTQARGLVSPLFGPTREVDINNGRLLLAGRAMRAFGFHANRRWYLPWLVARQSDAGFVERLVPNSRLLFPVSAGWVHAHAALNARREPQPALLLEPAHEDELSDNLNAWAGGSALADANGPAGLPGFVLPVGTTLRAPLLADGTVSLYAQIDADAGVLTVNSGAQRVTVDLAEPRLGANVAQATDDWLRVSVDSDASDEELVLSVSDGPVTVAVPQLDRSGRLTSPAIGDRRAAQRLAMFALDTSAGMAGTDASLDATVDGDGAFLQLLGRFEYQGESLLQGMMLRAASGGLTEVVATYDLALGPSTVPIDRSQISFADVGTDGAFAIFVREFQLFAKDNNSVRRGGAIPPVAGVSLVLLGTQDDDEDAVMLLRRLTLSDEMR